VREAGAVLMRPPERWRSDTGTALPPMGDDVSIARATLEKETPDDVLPSRFRPRYRRLSDEEIALHDEIKAKAGELEKLIEKCAPFTADDNPLVPEKARYRVLAITALEQAVMWAVKGLTL
jgi:hypothetical protein